MSISVREQLLANIVTAVSGQYRVTSAPLDDAELPVCVVSEGEEAATSDAVHDAIDIELPIVVAKGSLAADDSPETLRAKGNELLASIITEMYADETFGDLAESVEYTAGAIISEPGKRCLAEAQFIVRYQIESGDPFNRPS